jgi:hypothetical protein
MAALAVRTESASRARATALMTPPRAARFRAAASVAAAGGRPSRGWREPGMANEIHTYVQGMMTVGGGWMVASPMEVRREHGLVFLGGVLLVGLPVPARRTIVARCSPR